MKKTVCGGSKIKDSLNSRLALILGISPFNNRGQFSFKLFATSSTFIASVVIINFAATGFEIYYNYFEAEFENLEVTNLWMGLVLDLLTFSGLVTNFSAIFANRNLLAEYMVGEYSSGIRLEIVTVFSFLVCAVGICAALSGIDWSDGESSNVSVDYIWCSITCFVSFLYFLLSARYCQIIDSKNRQLQKCLANIRENDSNSLHDVVRNRDDDINDIERINGVFHLQVLIISVDVFLNCVYNGYTVIVYCILKNDSLLFGIACTAVVVVRFIILACVCTSCEAARKSVS
ncbi:Hypothetical protein NTJ_12926 [Nesidiocoris tenuis]|uniref:Gustatory receptor n=1 Tax=Nesidiocoris tenuis TaxID=355587 RepID=A0ABN7B8Z8_9HEMI|nr:Hypothetical protein NTJ_12926 [Nesidiocoris tenuis]